MLFSPVICLALASFTIPRHLDDSIYLVIHETDESCRQTASLLNSLPPSYMEAAVDF